MDEINILNMFIRPADDATAYIQSTYDGLNLFIFVTFISKNALMKRRK